MYQKVRKQKQTQEHREVGTDNGNRLGQIASEEEMLTTAFRGNIHVSITLSGTLIYITRSQQL